MDRGLRAPRSTCLSRRIVALTGSVHLPGLGALRHRMGCAGRGRGVVGTRRASTCWIASSSGKPAGRQPAHPEEAGGHADRDHAGPPGLPAPGPDEGCRRSPRWRSPPCMKRNSCGKSLDIARDRARHAGRQRHLRRIRRHPASRESRGREHLRGHARHSCPHPGQGSNGHSRVLKSQRPGAPRAVAGSAVCPLDLRAVTATRAAGRLRLGRPLRRVTTGRAPAWCGDPPG